MRYVARWDAEFEKIHAEHAAVVCRIFELYADGDSPRSIASHLNTEGIPSPGAIWNRTHRGEHGKRRDGKWVASCIHGDVTRGTGILNNPRYVGAVKWGRTQWVRSAANSAIRLQRMSHHDLVEHVDERLRIVSDELWERLKARQRQVFKASEGLRAALKSRKGRPARHLFSGLLKCDRCGSNFVRVNQKEYRCATYTNGGKSACGNGYELNAVDAEKLLLGHMENHLLSPEAIEVAVKEYADGAKRERRERQTMTASQSTSIALQQKESEIAQLKQMIRAGTIAAATLQPAIEAAERERDRLVERGTERSDGDAARVVRQLPDALHAYRGVVRRLSDAQTILTDAEYIEARSLICETLGGSIPVHAACGWVRKTHANP